MTRSFPSILKVLGFLPRAVAIVLVLWSPLIALQNVRAADAGITIEAPAQKKSNGVGFVLLVSLQRG